MVTRDSFAPTARSTRAPGWNKSRFSMRVLFLLPYSEEAASCRYRIHQYLPYLERNGVVPELRELVDPALFRILYGKGHKLERALRFARRSLTRLSDLRDAKDYDVLFIHRECFPFGPPVLERFLKRLGKPIVYDFDDAIYLPTNDSVLHALLRNPSKTNHIIRLADEVIVSTDHLKGFCDAYNTNVTVIPTSVDVGVFAARSYDAGKPPTSAHPLRLGWIGSHSTAFYLERLGPVLRRLSEKFPIELHVTGAGRTLALDGVNVIHKSWSMDTEVEEFRSFDIGVYPLVDDLWARGKGGFKATQFMAVGVPAVCSRVGVTAQMIRDGENGFLATSDDEWVEKLGRLAQDASLRRTIGLAGRQEAERRYSTNVNAPLLLDVLRKASARR